LIGTPSPRCNQWLSAGGLHGKQRVAERLTDAPPESGTADATSQYDGFQ
jgi:hypothetical protein